MKGAFILLIIARCFDHLISSLFGQAGAVDLTFNRDQVKYSVGPNEAVMTIAPLPDGKFLFGGFFTEYNGASQAGLVKVNDDGSIDPTFNLGNGLAGNNNFAALYKIIVREDSKILICGFFQFYNGISRKHIALLNPDGSLNHNFNPGTGTDSHIIDMAIQQDGKIIIIGFLLNTMVFLRRESQELTRMVVLIPAFKSLIQEKAAKDQWFLQG
jgi:hypothetical protein